MTAHTAVWEIFRFPPAWAFYTETRQSVAVQCDGASRLAKKALSITRKTARTAENPGCLHRPHLWHVDYRGNTSKYMYNTQLSYHLKSKWPWLWPYRVTQGQMWYYWTPHTWFLIDVRGYSCLNFFAVICLHALMIWSDQNLGTPLHSPGISLNAGPIFLLLDQMVLFLGKRKASSIRCFLPKIGPKESFSVLFTQVISMNQHGSLNTALQLVRNHLKEL